jgi:multiple sugar transport system permease protein
MRSSPPPRLAHGILILVTMTFAIPLVGMVIMAFRSPTNPTVSGPAFGVVQPFREVTQAMPYGTYLRNTLVLCAGTIAGTLVSCSLAAYAFARLVWRGRDFWFAILVATMLLPWHVTILPRFMVIRYLGLYDTLWSLILPAFLGNAFYIFLMRQFFMTIPVSLLEAARVDGLSEWRIFLQIVLPLSKPALASVALFQGVATWNDLSGPLIFLSDPAKFPLAYGLERFRSAYSDQTHLLMAAAILFTLPIAILFLLSQRTFIEGIATSGLKE